MLSLPVVRPVRVGLGVIRAGPNPLHFVAGVLLNLGFLIFERTGLGTDPSRTRQKVLLSCGASEWLTVLLKPVPSRHATDVTGSDNARAPCVGDDDRAGDQTNEGLSHPHGRIGQHPKGVGSRSRPEIDEPC